MRAFVLVVLLVAAPAAAQDNPGAWSPEHRPIADAISTAAVFTQIGLDTVHSWRSANRSRAFKRQAARLVITVAIAEAGKRLVSKQRPDRSDRKSWPSEHTAVSVASGGWRLAVSVPIDALVGFGRYSADKHDRVDIGSGAALGGIVGYLFR